VDGEDAYVAADHGDASGLALLSCAAGLGLRMDSRKFITMGDLYCKSGIDYEPVPDPAGDPRLAVGRLIEPSCSMALAPLAADNPWPMAPVPPALRHLQPTDVETLVVSSTLDYNTPVSVATREVMPFLHKGRQVILVDQAHTDATSLQGAAFRHLAVTFLETGQVEDTFVAQPVTFKPRWPLTRLAKLGVGAVVVLAALLLVLLL
jgi:hypothetical protein